MRRPSAEPSFLNRRQFLRQLGYLSPAILPAPFQLGAWPIVPGGYRHTLAGPADPARADFRLMPDYPSSSPLDDMLRLLAPGTDGYVTEKYAAELHGEFAGLRKVVATPPGPGPADLVRFLHESLAGSDLGSAGQAKRSYGRIELGQFSCQPDRRVARDGFAAQLAAYFASLGRMEVAEFEIVGLKMKDATPLEIDAEVRYTLVGAPRGGGREQRIGLWQMSWRQASEAKWLATRWIFLEESRVFSPALFFEDVTSAALGGIESYRKQLAHGVDHWRTVLDGASGIDVYGNNGIAAGDFDGDGRDDIYICQPSGLPNRLYRNRGDGRFEDVTENSGLGILDATACAIFADFENQGVQDLLVVTAAGPLLFQNQGNGRFAYRPDAFRFAKPPEGTFTHAAVADYDRDGRLDIYFCLYSYYLGLDQYHYPSPYFDARNGPPNFLFHNEGNGKFVDRTAASGLDAENDRYSFACAWGDISGTGEPDLYVANDFGRSNLYRNNGDGTFKAISDAAGVSVPGAGMSACWCDFANTGKQDIYVSNMWSAAGHRVSQLDNFHSHDAREIRGFYRQHARGNSLYRNQGHGEFAIVSESSGAAMGRWAWSADAWDIDHDGHSDVYIANGYISGTSEPEVSSFFWRQVVGNSPSNETPATNYERGWNAINELIRSDHSWSGYERNTVYLNRGNGEFSDISGISGLDLIEDSRAFALADLDGDGRLEVVVKNRNAPQVRVLRNVMNGLGDAICVRLRGTKSNRDAIGAAITARAGELRQTKYLQAGTGFLSQHSKEVFFGLGHDPGQIVLSLRWPSGQTQEFSDVPRNHRIAIEEGEAGFAATPFSPVAAGPVRAPIDKPAEEASDAATWLLDPLPAPDFSLPDLSGTSVPLSAFRGKPLLLCFWAMASADSVDQILRIQGRQSSLAQKGIPVISLNVDQGASVPEVRAFAGKQRIPGRTLVASPAVAGAYNIFYRFLFDRRRDLPIPCFFLLDEAGMIVKVYQGRLDEKQLLGDVAAIPRSYQARVGKGLPFPGTLYNGQFKRNDFTYGVALFQHGFLDAAAESFRQVIASKPDDAEAHYNLGTLYLRKNDLKQARVHLEQTVKLRAAYPEAWNNLGMIAGQENQPEEAVRDFKRSLEQRPDYVTALLNLGNIHRRQGNIAESGRLLNRAVELEPENAEANYSLGMLCARQEDFSRAIKLLQKSVEIRPNYPDAVNNLGVLYVRQGKNAEALQQFTSCIRIAPNFDQAYLNLARLYVLLEEKEKARETLQTLLKLQPEHKLAQQALGMLN
jgi:Flp pilus assembly protein TadD/peroxiredoxin